MDPLGSRANLAKSASIGSVRSLVKRYTASKEHLRLTPSLIHSHRRTHVHVHSSK